MRKHFWGGSISVKSYLFGLRNRERLIACPQRVFTRMRAERVRVKSKKISAASDMKLAKKGSPQSRKALWGGGAATRQATPRFATA